MADNKKGFVLYADQKLIFEDLTNEEAGVLIKHIFSYVNDENPILENRLLQVAFNPIKLQLKRDLVKWESEVIKRGDSGALGNLKRWNLDLYDKVMVKEINLSDAVEIAKSRKVSHPDKNSPTLSHPIANIADNVNVNVIVKDNVINIIEQYFLDFENGSHIVEMARLQKTTVEILKAYIPYFKLKVNSEYTTYGKFVDHFRNTWLLNKDKINLDKPKGGRALS